RLHAGKASDAGLTQAFLQRNVVREFREVVVPPRDGGDSELCLQHPQTPTRCFLRMSSCAALAARTLSRVETSGRPTSQSPSPGAHTKTSVTRAMTVVRSVLWAQSIAASRSPMLSTRRASAP